VTEYERDLCIALGGCSLPLGTRMKRFVLDMAGAARNRPEIEVTARQRYYLELMAWRLRRQLPKRFIPDQAPPPLPKVKKAARKKVVLCFPGDPDLELKLL
jgi:hypothetical protein